jgi:hypothetical protein
LTVDYLSPKKESCVSFGRLLRPFAIASICLTRILENIIRKPTPGLSGHTFKIGELARSERGGAIRSDSFFIIQSSRTLTTE